MAAAGTRRGGVEWRNAGELARRAAWSGDIARLSSIVAEFPSMATAKGPDGSTPAHWACLSGHGAVLSLLVQLGCTLIDLSAPDGRGQTPLHWAVIHNHEECVVTLQEEEADPVARGRAGLWQLRDKRGRTAAHWAADLGRPNMLNQLRTHHERHGQPGRELLTGVLSAADCSKRNVMELWNAKHHSSTRGASARMSPLGVVMGRCPAVLSRELMLYENRRLIADFDGLLNDATAFVKSVEASSKIAVPTPRAPKPLPYKWTEEYERGEAARLQRGIERGRRLTTRAARLEDAERREAAAMVSGDDATLDAVRAIYLELESEAQADEEEALAQGDVPHIVQGELQLDILLPSGAADLDRLRQEFLRELAQALGVTEEQLSDVSFVEQHSYSE